MKVSNKVLIEIPVSELEIGMYVSKLDCPWEETPFIYQGFFLYDIQDIQELQTLCKTVFVQAEKEVWEEKKKVTLSTGKERIRTVTKEKITYVNKVPAYRELEKAGATYNEAKRLISNIFAAVKLGKSFDVNEVRSVVTDIVGSILRNPNALQWLALIKNKDEYTAEHCLRVCVFAVSVGRELGMLEGELIDLGISGFLHDVGKTRVPDEVLNKPGRFTDAEYEVMKSHSTHGKNILISQNGVPPIAVDVAYTHHERIDGGGYPRRLSGHKISRFARIVCIVDAYDAMTSVRVYKTAMSSLESLRIIYEEKDVHFDPELAELFIKLIGVYPTGHIAELSSGEVGIIIKSNNEHRLKPKILRIIDSQNRRSKEAIIDLSANPVDDKGKPIRLKAVHPNGAFGIDIKPYLKKGLRLSESDDD
ncbi:HD-GYP domain-containing protein [Alkalimarinus sediminis]|uniref:HD-GYP domain-containing protein n=1 Tax=Alkalimarinus sediminis TaxID=1632866 RepID=A0A9E8KQU0_9ALTE|nr:HD-GYP domain-containing protein [Alkalimarinus sediminis]UZW76234.1 HD-GYP domain-containing protein [Alkalimarinus sediminis]